LQRPEHRFLDHTVDHAAAAAASEDERVRPFERLDTLEVVQVAVILHVVAHAVDVEVRRRSIAADDDVVAVVFPLVRADAGNVAHHVAHARHQLIAHQILRDDGDGLRHVEQRRRRFGRAANHRHLVAGRRADGDRLAHAGDLQHELERRGIRFERVDTLGQIGKPVRTGADDVLAGFDEDRKAAGLIGWRRDLRSLPLPGRGHARAGDWRAARIEHAALDRHARRGRLSGRDECGEGAERGGQKDCCEQERTTH
jgi:hypothetical protein